MIPKDFIDDLLAKTDIIDIIDQFVPLKKSGANYMACCPFHKEKTASFSVSPSKQFYHCFSCGAHGSSIGFVMEYQGLGFVEAVKFLADRVGMNVPNTHATSEQTTEQAAKKQQQKALENSIQVAYDFYRHQLPLHTQAVDYLNKRGLTSDVITRYGMGYAPNGWQPLAKVFQPYPSTALIESGMVVDNEGKQYDRFRHRIMFPIRDLNGQIVGFGGRVLDDSKPKYLNSSDSALFEKGKNLYGLYEARQSIKDAGRVLVVEGYMDVLALVQFGVGYAVAALGTATTAEHIKILFRQTDHVYFCFDGDVAGRKAAWRALENALPQLKDDKYLNFLFLPDNHDPDSFVRAFGRERFEEALLHESKPLSVYFWQVLTENIDISHQEGKADLVKSATPLLNQMRQAPTLAYLLRQQLSEKTGIDVVNLSHLMGQESPPRHVAAKSYQLPREGFRQPEMLSLVQKQIRALLWHPEWAGYVEFPDYLPVVDDFGCLLALAKFYQGHQSHEIGLVQALEFFRDTACANTLALVCRHMEHWADDSEAAQQDFIDGMYKLVNQLKNQQIEQLKQKENLNKQEMLLLMRLITTR